MNVFKQILLGLMLLWQLGSMAQESLSVISNGSLKRYAISAEREKNYDTGIQYLKEYLIRKPSDQQMKFLLGKMFMENRNYQEAHAIFLEMNQGKFPLAPFYQGEMEIRMGWYSNAEKTFNDFRKSYRGEKNDDYYRRLAKDKIEVAQTADTLSKREPNYLVERLKGDVNKVYIEQSPLLISSSDLIYTSLRSDTMIRISKGSFSELPKRKFHLAHKEGNTWKYKGEYSIHPFFDDYNLSSACLSPNGDRLIVSACKNGLDGQMMCQLYELIRNGDLWKSPTLLPEEVNSKGTSNTQPTFAPGCKADREMLYFVSERPDGKGGKDIWYSTYYIVKKKYREARNVGMKINTKGDELSPFYDMESAQLYFSSEGHPGLGGFDLYATQGYMGKWETPVNIGPPINSASDELFYSTGVNGTNGFFTSNRSGGEIDQSSTCCDDIYQFKRTDSAFTTLEGKLQFLSPKSNPVFVEVFLKNDNGDNLFVKRIQVDSNGTYTLKLLPGKKYEVLTNSEHLLTESLELDLLNMFNQQIVNWSPVLDEINKDPIVISDINFEFNKAQLTEQAKISLDSFLLPFLRNNPTLKVEVGAHTDNKGTAAFNQQLSQKRAESICNHLMDKGINAKRLTAKGYGELVPIEPNQLSDGSDNPVGRALNRRSEIKIKGRVEIEEED